MNVCLVEELRNLTSAAHALGMYIIVDVVMNHIHLYMSTNQLSNQSSIHIHQSFTTVSNYKQVYCMLTNWCIYIYIHVYIHMYTHIYIYIYICICIRIRISICMFICICICICVYIYIYTYLCINLSCAGDEPHGQRVLL